MLTVKRSAACAVCCALVYVGALAQKKEAASPAAGAVEKRHEQAAGTASRVTLAPQTVYERGAERVTLSGYYDPAEHRRVTGVDDTAPVMVNLEFAFTPAASGPEIAGRSEVVYLIDGRRERAQPATVKRDRIGLRLEDKVRVLTDVSVDLLGRMSRARSLAARVGGRELAFDEGVMARLAEFARALEN